MAETGRPLVVSIVVADGLVGSFGLGVCSEVFGYDRRAMGLPLFDFGLVSEAPGVLRTDTGIPITVEHVLERLVRSDIISITAWELFDRVPSPVLLDAFRAAHARGATIVSHCTGAFVLAAAGLLDGLRVTTHWKYAGELAARFPAVHVDPSVLYVDNGRVITGAGTAAGPGAPQGPRALSPAASRRPPGRPRTPGCWAGGWPRRRRCWRTATRRSRRSPGWSASARPPACASSSPAGGGARRAPTAPRSVPGQAPG